jgi:hypothetical protein
MPLYTQPSPAARTALTYITLGALMVVWGGLWSWYLWHHPTDNTVVYYLCTGVILTGVTLLVIGLAIGQIGWAARHADLPPEGHPPTAVPVPPAAPPAPQPTTVAGPPGGSVPVETPVNPPAVPPAGVVASSPAVRSSDGSPPDRVAEQPKARSGHAVEKN